MDASPRRRSIPSPSADGRNHATSHVRPPLTGTLRIQQTLPCVARRSDDAVIAGWMKSRRPTD
jgi:hypothetical protein